MKRFTSYLLIVAMLISCVTTIFVTTASAAATVISVGKSYSTTAKLHGSMPDGGSDLTDGSKSNSNAGTNANGPYVGYSILDTTDTTVEIILDLGTAQNSNVFTLYAAGNFWGIAAPKDFAISYSDSATGTFTPATGSVVTTKVGDGETIDGSVVSLHTVTFTSISYINARYIKYTITPKGSFVWLDEIEAAFDSSLPNVIIPTDALRVHHVNSVVSANQISVFTDHDAFSTADPNGWGVYYQLRSTGFASEYAVVEAKINPGSKYSGGTWNFTDVAGDIYMQVNGGTANAAVYGLAAGDKVTFINLELTAGDYTDTYVYAGSAASKLNGAGQYVLSVEPRSNYADDARTKLTDGVKSTKSVGSSAAYNAFDLPNGDLEIILDLGAVKKTDTYTVYTGKNFYGVNLPTDVKISYSETADGPYTEAVGKLVNTFVGEGNTYNNGTQDITPQLYAVSYVCEEANTARYIKYTITPASNRVLWTDEIEATLSAKNGPVIVDYTTSVSPRDDIPDSGKELLDGVTGQPDVAYAGKSYVGYNVSGTMDLILDLGAVKNTDSYTLYTAENFWGVWTPKNVAVSCSNAIDGVFTPVTSTMEKTKVGDADPYTSSSGTWTPHLYSVKITPDKIISARYIKLTITPNGGAVWLDEVEATLAENSSNWASYTVSSDAFHADVRSDDGVKLTDGIRSSADFSSSNYVAWTGIETVDIILNLGKVKSTDTYSIYGPENFWGVWTPETISVAYSDSADGEFTAIDGNVSKILIGDGNAYKSSNGTYYTAQMYEIRLTAEEAVDAQYIKITVPANGNNIWIDEVSASLGAVAFPKPVPTSFDPSRPTTQCNVHHVDKYAGTGEISVFTTLDKLYECEIGWGMYYQLRATPNANEFTIVGAVGSPKNNYQSDADADKALFKKYLGFTTPSKWNLPDGIYDIYMVVKGTDYNPSMMELPIGRTITFTNLTLTEGDYTNTTVMASAASGTISGMIDNEITETNLAHALANVQKVDASAVSAVLSADNAPADAFFSGNNLDYNAILTACINNKVLPTIQIDTAANANSLIAAMRSTGCYDVNVISADSAILAQIRGATNIARTGLIYNLTKSVISVEEAHSIRTTVRSAPATFVVFNSTYVSKQVVSELQELGIAVWVKVDTANGTNDFNIEAVDVLACGVNGIITVDSAAVYNLINTHFLKDTFTHTPSVVGHRGYPALEGVTENTISSFIAAYEYGADIFELDVYTTTDNALVIFHDYSFGTSSGKNLTTFTGTEAEGAIQNMTKAQVDAIKYKTGESITYLDEILAYFKDKDIRIFIEFKGSQYERTVKATANAVKAYGMEDQVCVISAALGYIEQTNKYLPGMTGSYVYANNSLTGYAPQDTPAWSNANTREENLAILSFALNLIQPYNANLSPALGAVSLGYRTSHYMGESTANRGLVLNPWTYGSAWNNNVGFFSKVDSITTDVVDWATNMAKFVSAEDIVLVNGQTYNGSGFTATTYGRETYDIDLNDVVYSIVSGDCVEVQDGRLVAVKDGEAKIMLGYKTKTSSGVDYVLYSEVITVTVDSDNVNVLKPLIALAEQMTVKDFNETDLITLRELYATAVALVNSYSTDAEAITETAIALSDLLDNRFGNVIVDVTIGSYDTTDPNYYKWDSTTGSQSTELHPNHIDDHIRLTDGIKNSSDPSSTAYSAWQNVDVDVIVNLGSAVKSNVFNAYFADGLNGIAAPKGLTISYMDENGVWQNIDTDLTIEQTGSSNGWNFYKYTAVANEAVTAQYVKITVKRNGIFVWMDEVEVQHANGAQVSGDYIYITGMNETVNNGEAVIYTSTENANYQWTNNIVAEWSDFYQAYVAIDVFKGSGENTPVVSLSEGQILIAVHDWESLVTDGTQVAGSAKNASNASKVQVGQLLVGYGVDIANESLSIAPYIRFIDSDHECEDNGDGWNYDENGHWHTCVCGEIVDYAEHSPATEWSSDFKTHWHECECGYQADHDEHSAKDDTIYNDETSHWKLCVCGEKVEVAEHIPGAEADCENDQICTICEYILVEAKGHKAVSDEWHSDKDSHWKLCSCGEILDETTHTPGAEADCENDQICRVCEYVIVVAYGHMAENDTWYSDANGHWHKCSCGENVDFAEHDEGEWRIVEPAQVGVEGEKVLCCTECGFVLKTEKIPALEEEHVCSAITDWYNDETGHWKLCSCGEKVEVSDHEPGAEADCENDQICTVCEYVIVKASGHKAVSDTWSTDKNSHWHVCSCGELLDEAEHIPSSEADCENDQICKVCEYVIVKAYGHKAENDTWYNDDTSHWKLCSCGEKVEVSDHNPGAAADCENDQICTDCGYVLVEASGHSAKDDTLYKDETGHWKLCACGEKLEFAEHNAGDAADCENDQLCIDCGYVITEKTGHDYKATVTAPTCEDKGYTTHTCESCGDSYVDDYTDAHGHKYEWVVTKEAEVGVDGEKQYICTECNHIDESKTEVIPALPDDDWMLGDVNMNGKIDMTDYILLKRAYFGTYDLNEEQEKRGDCNQNGKIDMTDYILLKRAYFGTYVVEKK